VTVAVVAALLVSVRDDSDRQPTSAQSSVRRSHDCPVTVRDALVRGLWRFFAFTAAVLAAGGLVEAL
jgi:hypothetical protein